MFELRCHFCGRLLATGLPTFVKIKCDKCGYENWFRRRNFVVDSAQFADKLESTTSSPRAGHNAFHARTEGLK
jgi:phage FluMu protein Com